MPKQVRFPKKLSDISSFHFWNAYNPPWICRWKLIPFDWSRNSSGWILRRLLPRLLQVYQPLITGLIWAWKSCENKEGFPPRNKNRVSTAEPPWRCEVLAEDERQELEARERKRRQTEWWTIEEWRWRWRRSALASIRRAISLHELFKFLTFQQSALSRRLIFKIRNSWGQKIKDHARSRWGVKKRKN